MEYDGHRYDIRPAADGNGYELWTSQFSRNSTSGGRPLVKSVIFSLADDEAIAEAEIFKQVIDNSDWWMGCEVMTDAAYDAMMAELATEEAE